MKWLGRVLILIVAFLGLSQVFNYGLSKKVNMFYEENAVPLIDTNKKDEYLEMFFTATMSHSYLKDPIYIGTSNEGVYPLDFSVYSAKAKKGDNQAILFYFNDKSEDGTNKLDYKSLITNYENYQSNKRLVALEYRLKFENIDEVIKYNISIEARYRTPVNLMNVVDGEFYFNGTEKNKVVGKKSKKLNKIEIVLVDHTETKGADDNKIKETNLLTVNNNDEAVMGTKDALVMNDKNFLETNNFNGNVTGFDLEKNYNDDSKVVVIDTSLIKPYNKYMIKPIVIFSLIAVVVLYVVFLFKPTMNFIEQKRKAKKAKDTSKEEIEVLQQASTEVLEEIQTEVVAEELEENVTEEDVIEEEIPAVLETVVEKIDYNTYTVAELKEIAKALELVGYSTLRKAELIKLIEENI